MAGGCLSPRTARPICRTDRPAAARTEDDQDIWIIDTSTRKIEKTVYSLAADLRVLALAPRRQRALRRGQRWRHPAAAERGQRPAVCASGGRRLCRAGAADYGKVRRRADLTRQASAARRALCAPCGHRRDRRCAVAVGRGLGSAGRPRSLHPGRAAPRRGLPGPAAARRARGWRGRGPLLPELRRGHRRPDGTLRQTVAVSSDPGRPPSHLARRSLLIREALPPTTRAPAAISRRRTTAWCGASARASGTTCARCSCSQRRRRLSGGLRLQRRQLRLPRSRVDHRQAGQHRGGRGLGGVLGSLLGAPGHARDAPRWQLQQRSRSPRPRAVRKKLPCASCHAPPLYTSRTFIARGKSGEPADVPSLLGVYRHGVYMVNGAARSLDAAVDVALAYVGRRSPRRAQRPDQLPSAANGQGAAPLGIWP